MFNIGGGEFLVIALIALVVLGPTRLPEAARTAGKVMADLRRISTGFQNEIKDAFDDADRSNTARVETGGSVPAIVPSEMSSQDIAAAFRAVSEQATPELAPAPKKRAPAKKTAAKKAPAKKAAAPAKKTPAKKTPAKKAPAKKAVAKKATAVPTRAPRRSPS